MKEEPVRHTASENSYGDLWTWIILAGLLVLGVVVGVGSLALTNFNQQSERATGSQTVPSSR